MLSAYDSAALPQARRAHFGMAEGGNQPRTRRRNLLALGAGSPIRCF